MKTTLRRSLTTLAVASAVLLGASGAAPAQATPADGHGEIVVHVLDHAGKPVAGMITVAGIGLPDPGLSSMGLATQLGGSLPVGRYGVQTMTPWGGYTCAGLDTCTYGGVPTTLTGPGAFDVTDVETPLAFTLTTLAPARITGGRAVGDEVEIAWSAGMQKMLPLFANAAAYGPSVTWLRDGAPIKGKAGSAYELTPADVGHTVSARLAYGTESFWTLMGGTSPAPYAVPGVQATRRSTRTTVDLFRSSIAQGRGTGILVDVTSAKAPVTDGKVKVTVGKWTTTRAVRNGSARTALPRTLKPGRYQVLVTYLGSPTYLTSKGPKQTLTVTKKK